MKNPDTDNIIKNSKRKNKRKGHTLSDWILTISIIVSTIILIAILSEGRWLPTERYEPSPCMKLELGAQNTLSALASYFSEPDRVEVPTVEDLVAHEDLVIYKNSTVIIDGTYDRVRVTVIDNTGKCRRGKKYVIQHGENWESWYSE
jgi:hypothetical protein